MYLVWPRDRRTDGRNLASRKSSQPEKNGNQKRGTSIRALLELGIVTRLTQDSLYSPHDDSAKLPTHDRTTMA
jgi:hypothetical protein